MEQENCRLAVKPLFCPTDRTSEYNKPAEYFCPSLKTKTSFLSSYKTQRRKHSSPGILDNAPNTLITGLFALPWRTSDNTSHQLWCYGGLVCDVHHSPCGTPQGHTCSFHFLKLRLKRISKSLLLVNVVAEYLYSLQTLLKLLCPFLCLKFYF